MVKLPLNFIILYNNAESPSIAITENSKGAAIFKKMLEDKKAIQDHISKGGKIEDLKEKFNFVKPLSTSEE